MTISSEKKKQRQTKHDESSPLCLWAVWAAARRNNQRRVRSNKRDNVTPPFRSLRCFGGLNRLTNPAVAAAGQQASALDPHPMRRPHQAPIRHPTPRIDTCPSQLCLPFFPCNHRRKGSSSLSRAPPSLDRFQETPLADAWARTCHSTVGPFHLSFSSPSQTTPRSRKQGSTAVQPFLRGGRARAPASVELPGTCPSDF
jgi:hypothetical protein